MAGHDVTEAKRILWQVANHLHYLHAECKMIHGDVKSRNLVETVLPNGTTSWILIDLDAACPIGSDAGQKITSSAFYPPEMAQYTLRKQLQVAATPPLATVAFEMWYFGLMVAQVSNSQTKQPCHLRSDVH